MLTELKIAVNWICETIYDNLTSEDSGRLPADICQKKVNEFRLALFKTMFVNFKANWNNPAYREKRVIRIHHDKNDSMNDCIEQALEDCECTYRTLRLHNLCFDLIINPGMVVVKQEGKNLFHGNDEQLDQNVFDDQEIEAIFRVLTWNYIDVRPQMF